jgi:hypothetical protein
MGSRLCPSGSFGMVCSGVKHAYGFFVSISSICTVKSLPSKKRNKGAIASNL